MSATQDLYKFARQYMVGGVSSSTRLNRALGYPFYVSHGEGGRVFDADGHCYVDLCMSHGASLLGHGNPGIIEAVQRALGLGIVCSYETQYHSQLAKKVTEMIPCAELVRFTGSGTEATMHAIRLARAYTGKEKIIKFEGHFHGYHDYVMFNHGHAGPEMVPVPPLVESAGVPASMVEHVIVLPFNDLDALEQTIELRKDEVAAVILEPINYNSGCIAPFPDYVKAMRELTADNGLLLIFDEVLSAFRMRPGSGQAYLGITPDVCTLGKAVGGGVPLSVICGKSEIMEGFRPVGECEHSGTYNGHLIPILAGLASLNQISAPDFYDRIDALGERLYSGIEDIIRRSAVRARIQYLGARFGLFFGVGEPVTNFHQALQNDTGLTLKFVAAAHEHGVYFHDYGGRAVHHGFSSAHTAEDIDSALEGIEAAFQELEREASG